MKAVNHYDYDAFISHAVEDKMPIANELCERLEKAGLRIWYSGKELKAGDRLEESIHLGLQASRYGIVILSPTYVSKMWTLREFYSLLSREYQGHKVILPILYDITPEELAKKDLTMAGMFALRADKGMDYLVDYLVNEIRMVEPVKKSTVKWKSWLTIAAVLLIAVVGYLSFRSFRGTEPGRKDIAAVVNQRTALLESEIQSAIIRNGLVETTDTVSPVRKYLDHKRLNTARFRNEFHLLSKYGSAHSRKQVENILQLDFDSLSPLNMYGISSVKLYAEKDSAQTPSETDFGFQNKAEVRFETGAPVDAGRNTWEVKVTYINNVRFILTSLEYPPPGSTAIPKRYQVRIYATPPSETFLIRHSDGTWQGEILEVQ